MKFLFIIDKLGWPRISGPDVHGSQMMRSLANLGHKVSLGTQEVTSLEATNDIELHSSFIFGGIEKITTQVQETWLQRKYRNYWGVSDTSLAAIQSFAQNYKPDVVVTIGLGGLPYLLALPDTIKIWYAADEWALHHITLIRFFDWETWSNLKTAIFRLGYERAYAKIVDRVWVVTKQDKIAMRHLAGFESIDIIPNGVDTDYFYPRNVKKRNLSCVFWGRLDFLPNVQSLEWFCTNVWPSVLAREPNAQFTICGFSPNESVKKLARIKNIYIKQNLDDLREEVSRSQIAILPMISGAGIKNKLLEAASLGLPIICTQRACMGLRTKDLPVIVADDKQSWSDALLNYWTDQALRETDAVKARAWVTAHHSWRAAADDAMKGLEEHGQK